MIFIIYIDKVLFHQKFKLLQLSFASLHQKPSKEELFPPKKAAINSRKFNSLARKTKPSVIAYCTLPNNFKNQDVLTNNTNYQKKQRF